MGAIQKRKQEPVSVTLVACYKGVLTLIDTTGNIRNYAQRGINRLSQDKIQHLIRNGELSRDIMQVPELPSCFMLYRDTGNSCRYLERFNGAKYLKVRT